MNRMYSVLTVKAVEEEQRVIRGIATTPNPDRVGDIVEPLGVRFKNPMPLLHQHDHDKPVGTVTFDTPTKDGITFEAKLPKIEEAGPLRDRIETAWGELKAGLVRAVSIGFRSLEHSWMDDGGIRFIQTEVLELSLVSVPANADAMISTIKSIDRPLLAASGKEPKADDRPVAPGAAGKTKHSVNLKIKENPAMKTIAEQIAALEASRQAKAARMAEVMQKSMDEGRSTDQAEQEEFDSLAQELDAIDGDLKRLRALEKAQALTAKPVIPGAITTAAAGAAARSGAPVQVKANIAKGTAFTRFAMALMAGKGNLMQSVEIAKRWADQTPEVETVLKAAVAAGTTTDPTWAKPLVEYQNMASEFAELLRPATIIGRIPGLRRVPFNIKVPRQTGGSSASWVGEGAPKPVSALAFDQINLGVTKLAGIVVMTDELVRFSNPSAEAIVRQDLIDTIVQTMDKDFVDPANAGTAGVKPGSITNGVAPVVASGTDADAVRADVQKVMGKFVTANLSLSGAVWIMTEMQALAFALMLNPLGQREFPDIEINGESGGRFFGLPVVLSENVPLNPGSGDPVVGAGSRIILAKASEIMLADDGETLLDASNQASLQMDSAPTNPPTDATVMVSLWQMNLVGIRAERFINWTKRRPGAVQWIDSAAYGQA
ncbi:phage major capsid protein [Sinorhizobium medicae]|uniref:phage major capsid protein n=1 Tax=Sinorhizobium medicae TaxID=110321 RepID=UPI000FD916B5|nr:phage major capsid protein [Sinorhizobium medicae]RVI90785.1 phage major capsid protein [Sinorhizobium medicae]